MAGRGRHKEADVCSATIPRPRLDLCCSLIVWHDACEQVRCTVISSWSRVVTKQSGLRPRVRGVQNKGSALKGVKGLSEEYNTLENSYSAGWCQSALYCALRFLLC